METATLYLLTTGAAAQKTEPERLPTGQAVAATEAVSLDLFAASQRPVYGEIVVENRHAPDDNAWLAVLPAPQGNRI